MVPIFAKTVDKTETDDAVYAKAFTALIQKNVFDPIGCPGIWHGPPTSAPGSDSYAYTYSYPGNMKGNLFPEGVKEASSGGYYLTIDEASRLMHSFLVDDGRICDPGRKDEMIAVGKSTPMGLDNNTWARGNPDPTVWTQWVQKNGGSDQTANGGAYSASIALFGYGLYSALFLNSPPTPPPRYQAE